MRTLLAQVVCAGLGGCVGAILRLALSLGLQKLWRGFPLGTLVVNLLGCLALGLLMGATDEAKSLSPETRSFLAIGLLGSFTTFSTFSAEAVQLMRERQHLPVLLYVVGSVVLGLLCFVVGHALGLRWAGAPPQG